MGIEQQRGHRQGIEQVAVLAVVAAAVAATDITVAGFDVVCLLHHV